MLIEVWLLQMNQNQIMNVISLSNSIPCKLEPVCLFYGQMPREPANHTVINFVKIHTLCTLHKTDVPHHTTTTENAGKINSLIVLLKRTAFVQYLYLSFCLMHYNWAKALTI